MKKRVLIPALSALCIATALSAAETPAAPAKDEKAAPAKAAEAAAPAAKTEKAAPAKAEAAAPAKDEKADADQWAFLPPVVAEMGDKKITKEDFLKEVQDISAGGALPPQLLADPERKKVIVRQMVQGLVDKNILIMQFEKAGLKPGPELVIAEFEKAMKAMSAEQLEQLKKDLAMDNETLDSYKAKISKDANFQLNIAMSAWVEKTILPTIEVKDEDVEKYYRENQEHFKTPEAIKASHILVSTMPKAPEKKDAAKAGDKAPEKKDDAVKAEDTKSPEEIDKAARKKAEEILAKLKQGQDFGALAEKESDCPSKDKKGSLPEFGKGMMVKEFEDAAFALKPGEMSDIVKTQFGYHIIKVEEKKEAGVVPLDDKVKDFIKGQLKDRKLREAIQKLLEEEKTKLNVKMNV